MELLKAIMHRALHRLPRLHKTVKGALRAWRESYSPVLTGEGFIFDGLPSMMSGSYEPETCAFLKNYVDASTLFINVGANSGYFVCMALKQGAFAIAIEPSYSNYIALMRNIERNGWQARSLIFHLAAGASNGIGNLYGGGTGASMLRGWSNTRPHDRELVSVVGLDDLVPPHRLGNHLLFLLDCEGYELDVLQGSKRLLELNPRPQWIIETSAAEHASNRSAARRQLRDLLQLMDMHGYVPSTVAEVPKRLSTRHLLANLKTADDEAFPSMILFHGRENLSRIEEFDRA